MQGEMECVTTNLIDRFNEKVVEEIPLLVGNALFALVVGLSNFDVSHQAAPCA